MKLEVNTHCSKQQRKRSCKLLIEACKRARHERGGEGQNSNSTSNLTRIVGDPSTTRWSPHGLRIAIDRLRYSQQLSRRKMRFDQNLHSCGVTTSKRILHRDMSVCVLREREREEEEEQVEEWTWRRKQKRKRIPFASKLKDNKCRILLLTPTTGQPLALHIHRCRCSCNF